MLPPPGLFNQPRRFSFYHFYALIKVRKLPKEIKIHSFFNTYMAKSKQPQLIRPNFKKLATDRLKGQTWDEQITQAHADLQKQTPQDSAGAVDTGKQSPEKKATQTIPKNTRLYVHLAYPYDHGLVDKSQYPTLQSYLEYIAQTIKDQKPEDQSNLELLKSYGLKSEADCYHLLTNEVVSEIVNIWVANEEDEGVKRQYQEYLKDILKKPETATAHTLPPERKVHEKKVSMAENPELKTPPVFKYLKGGILLGIFDLKDDKYDKPRTITVNIPKIANSDLKNQKPNLEIALMQLMKENNYKANPKILVEDANDHRLIFSYGGNPVFQLSSETIRKNLETVPSSLGEDALDDYIDAKKFLEKNVKVDFNKAPTGLKADIVQAARVVKTFESELRKMPTGLAGESRPIGRYSRDVMFEQLWKKEIGPEGLKQLQKIAGSSGPEHSGFEDSDDPVLPPKGEKVSKRTDEFDFSNPEFKKSADNFCQELESNYSGKWEVLLQDPAMFVVLAKKYKLTNTEAIRLAGQVFIKTNPGVVTQEQLNELFSSNRSQLREKLTKQKIPISGKTWLDMLLSYLAYKITNTESSVDVDQEEDDDSGDIETSNGEGQEEDGTEQDKEEEEEIDESLLEDSLEIVAEIIEEQGDINEELLLEKTGLQAEQLEKFLLRVLADLGREDDFISGYKEYQENFGDNADADSKLELMMRAVKEYYLLNQSREKKRQEAEAKATAVPNQAEQPKAQEKNTPAEAGEVKGQEVKPVEKNPPKEGTASKETIKGLPVFLEQTKAYSNPPCLLVKDKVSGQQFFAVFGDGGKIFKMPLPQGTDMENEEQRKAMAISFGKYIESCKNSLTPEIVLEGKITGSPQDKLGVVLRLGEKGTLKITQEEFLDRGNVRADQRDKPEQNPYFKMLLLERLYKFRALGETISAEDKKQIDLTVTALQSIFEAPLEKGPGFSQEVVRLGYENFGKESNPSSNEPETSVKAVPSQRPGTGNRGQPRGARQNSRPNRDRGARKENTA